MAIKNRLVKLITISAGACLILGSLAGCKSAEEPEATAAASEAQEESETETEAPQASVATSDTEDPATSDTSDDFVIEPEYLELDSDEQKYANTYITNFVEQYFYDFLNGLKPDDIKSECLLPIMMDQLIAEGKIETVVLHTPDRWFGLTYQEDKPGVVAGLQALHDAGVYPDTLWD